jgi:AmiR/NasT family two-component response regulator
MRRAPGSDLHPDVGETLRLRAEVHQATGFLSVHASVGIDEALLLLRAYAFSADRPLLEVARDVLSERLRIPLKEDEG